MPLREIADRTKFSLNTVYERIKKMIQNDLIQGFTAVFNSRKMGLEYYRIPAKGMVRD